MNLSNPGAENPITVVFDLDGTLAHTSPDIAAALNAALASYGKQVSVAETERMIGGGLRTLLSRAMKLTSLELSEEEADRIFEQILVSYRASPVAGTRLHDWVTQAMIEFHGRNSRIAVCSNKAEDLVLQILDALDVSRWVHGVVGYVETREKKPHPEPLLLSIERAGGEVSRSILIGDSGADVGAARAAGIPVVLVPHGYGSKDLRELDGDRIVSNFDELQAAIIDLAGAKAA